MNTFTGLFLGIRNHNCNVLYKFANIDFWNMNFDIDSWIEGIIVADIGHGDHTALACVPSDAQGRAHLLVKEEGVLCGIELAKKIFHKVDSTLVIEVFLKDGDKIKKGDIAFIVSGSKQSILRAERIVLNMMQRMSGIASKSNDMARLVSHTKCKILDTRKTTPGIRYFEKYAVKTGGAENHRFGLYDMIMIKDNHIDYSGSIENAISTVKEYLKDKKLNLKIEVEARDLKEVREILACGHIDRILLDNFSYEDMRTAVALIGELAETEASGNITEETVRDYAECGVDYISSGALTHSVKSLDLSLKAID